MIKSGRGFVKYPPKDVKDIDRSFWNREQACVGYATYHVGFHFGGVRGRVVSLGRQKGLICLDVHPFFTGQTRWREGVIQVTCTPPQDDLGAEPPPPTRMTAHWLPYIYALPQHSKLSIPWGASFSPISLSSCISAQRKTATWFKITYVGVMYCLHKEKVRIWLFQLS